MSSRAELGIMAVPTIHIDQNKWIEVVFAWAASFRCWFPVGNP
jgi:hypothetical protein